MHTRPTAELHPASDGCPVGSSTRARRFVSLLLDGAVLVLLHPYRGRNPEAKNIAYYAGVRTIEYLQVPYGPSECRRADVCVCVHARVCARARVCLCVCNEHYIQLDPIPDYAVGDAGSGAPREQLHHLENITLKDCDRYGPQNRRPCQCTC
jgi:hypothetical protein